MYNELLKRIRRAEELKVVVEKLEVRKNIADSKGKQMKPKKVCEMLHKCFSFIVFVI